MTPPTISVKMLKDPETLARASTGYKVTKGSLESGSHCKRWHGGRIACWPRWREGGTEAGPESVAF